MRPEPEEETCPAVVITLLAKDLMISVGIAAAGSLIIVEPTLILPITSDEVRFVSPTSATPMARVIFPLMMSELFKVYVKTPSFFP